MKSDVNAIFQKCNLRRKVDFERRGYADSKGYPLELSPIAGTETIILSLGLNACDALELSPIAGTETILL